MGTQEAGTEGTQQGESGAQPERPNLQTVIERVRAKAAESAKTAEAAAATATAAAAETADSDDEGEKDGDDDDAQSPAEIRLAALQKRLNDADAKLKAAEGAASAAEKALIERLKKQPARVLKEHLGDKAWQQLADDFERMETPGVAAATEAEARLAKRVEQLEEQVKKDNDALANAQMGERMRAAEARAAEALEEHASDFPIASRKENVGEAVKAAIVRAGKTARKILDARKESGDDRPITQKHAEKLLLKALGKVEEKLADRGKRYQPPEPKLRRGISATPSVGGARMASASTIDPKAPLQDRKRELLDRIRRATQRPST